MDVFQTQGRFRDRQTYQQLIWAAIPFVASLNIYIIILDLISITVIVARLTTFFVEPTISVSIIIGVSFGFVFFCFHNTLLAGVEIFEIT